MLRIRRYRPGKKQGRKSGEDNKEGVQSANTSPFASSTLLPTPFSFQQPQTSAFVMSILRRRNRSTSNFIPILCLLHIIALSIIPYYCFLYSSVSTLPPSSSPYTPLSATLPHVKRPLKPVENDWTAPSILTALATSTNEASPSSDFVSLLLFTSGIDTGVQERALDVLACVVGELLFPVTSILGFVVVCRVPKSALLPTPKDSTSKPPFPRLSVLLEDNFKLKRALNKTQRINDLSFSPLFPHITRLSIPTGLSIPPCYIVKSSLTFHPSMLQMSRSPSPSISIISRVSSKPPYGLCLMTAMRQYPHLIPPFLAYYRRLGVDRFYFYDNMCEQDLKTYEAPDVEVVYWPWARSQAQSFMHFLHAATDRCQWVAFFDTDEYAFVGADDAQNISDVGLLKQYIDLRWSQGYGQLMLPFIRMRNNAHIEIPRGNLPELYTMRDTHVRYNGVGKVIVSTSCAWGKHGVHFVGGWNIPEYGPESDCATYRNTTMDLNPSRLMDNAHLVHYTRRSWEEHRLKHRFGTASSYTQQRQKKYLEEVPPKWYMEGGAKYTTFREYWRRVMQE